MNQPLISPALLTLPPIDADPGVARQEMLLRELDSGSSFDFQMRQLAGDFGTSETRGSSSVDALKGKEHDVLGAYFEADEQALETGVELPLELLLDLEDLDHSRESEAPGGMTPEMISLLNQVRTAQNPMSQSQEGSERRVHFPRALLPMVSSQLTLEGKVKLPEGVVQHSQRPPSVDAMLSELNFETQDGALRRPAVVERSKNFIDQRLPLSGTEFLNLRQTPSTPEEVAQSKANHSLGDLLNREAADVSRIQGAVLNSLDRDPSQTFGDSDRSDLLDQSRESMLLDSGGVPTPGRTSLNSTLVPEMVQRSAVSAAPNELPQALVLQVSREVRQLAAQGGGEFRFKLRPDHLGELQIRVRSDGSSVQLEMNTENEKVRKLFDESISELRSCLSEHQLTLTQFDCHVGREAREVTSPFFRGSESSNFSGEMSFQQGGSFNESRNQQREFLGEGEMIPLQRAVPSRVARYQAVANGRIDVKV